MGKVAKLLRSIRQSQFDCLVNSILSKPVLFAFVSPYLILDGDVVDFRCDNVSFCVDGAFVDVSVVDPACDAFLSFMVGGVEGVCCRWSVCGGVGCWVEVCRWCRYRGEWLRLSGRDVALNHLSKSADLRRLLVYAF